MFDYVDGGGVNCMVEWYESLGTSDRATLDSKVNMIKSAGLHLGPKLIAGTGVGNISKLRFFGKARIQRRPRLCAGPCDSTLEVTFLIGANEIGDETVPANANQIAVNRRQDILDNRNSRRMVYKCHEPRRSNKSSHENGE